MGQLLATIQSGMKKISDKCLAAGTKLKAKIIKHKRKLRWIALILAVLILITTLILECYSFVDSLSQGIVINNTAGVLVAGNVYNQGNFVGLGSSYLTLPNTNMLINFDSSRENAYPSIIARVQ